MGVVAVSDEVTNVRVSAFVESGTTFRFEPPREYTSPGGERSVTPWILHIGGYGPNGVVLYFRDQADAGRLIAELVDKLGWQP